MLRLVMVAVLYVLHGCPDVDAERAKQAFSGSLIEIHHSAGS